MAGSGSVPSRKSCMDPVLHTQKGSMFFRLSPPDLLGFLDCKQKKSFPDTECKVRQQFFTDTVTVIDRFSLKGCRFVCVCCCFLGGGGGLINCPKVLM